MDLKRLQELISSHEYKKDKGLMVRIDYSNCQEVFNDILKMDPESSIKCVAGRTGICVSHFEHILGYYICKDIESFFIEICLRKNLR
jgi:hypothetical protein